MVMRGKTAASYRRRLIQSEETGFSLSLFFSLGFDIDISIRWLGLQESSAILIGIGNFECGRVNFERDGAVV